MIDPHRLAPTVTSALSGAEIAAAWLCCGVDLTRIAEQPPVERSRIAARLARDIQKERMKGLGGARGYSLDRHIALKRSLDRLTGAKASAENGSGARRRRHFRTPRA
ncbi:MAG: hypothetical protein INR68_04365 [Methylobacterium mesophilicum]|nr:hypothetical protein [Methylobacterium mesophilicum]